MLITYLKKCSVSNRALKIILKLRFDWNKDLSMSIRKYLITVRKWTSIYNDQSS